MSLSSASTIVGEPLIQEINSDGTTAMPELFSRPSTSPPRIILIMPPPPELPDIMQALQHAGHKFQTVSFNSRKFAGSQAHIKKECSVCFSVDTVITSQDIVVGFDKAGELTSTISFRFNGRQATTRGLSVSILKLPGMMPLTNQTSRLRDVWSSSVIVKIAFLL